MRAIHISTDVYAALWAARQAGEDDEDAILRRVLGVARGQESNIEKSTNSSLRVGFVDSRFGVELPEGFEIFRTYLGKEYRAHAFNGAWVLEGSGRSFPSLNQLSRAVGAKVENAWSNWYFRNDRGQRQLITALRK